MPEHYFPAKLVWLKSSIFGWIKIKCLKRRHVVWPWLHWSGSMLFHVYSSTLHSKVILAGLSCKKLKSIITRLHMFLCFMVYINLTGIDRRADHLKWETAKIGFTINSTETKCMIAVIDRGRSSGASAEVVVDGNVFKVVDEFERLTITVKWKMYCN